MPLLFVFLAGCGGGGGPKPRRGAGLVSVFTSLTNVPPDRRISMRVSRFDATGDTETVAQKEVAASDSTQVDLSGLPPIDLHLHGALLDGSGLEVGAFDTLVNGTGVTTLEATDDQAAATVQVTPRYAHIRQGETRRFFATGKTSAGRLILVGAGGRGIGWTSNNAAAPVSDGVVEGVSEGSATIVATFGSSGASGAAGVSGSATATVTDLTPRKWTILVYMNGANDLARFGTLNVNQMEKVAGTSDVRTVVQWKTLGEFDSSAPFEGTRRILTRPDTTGTIASAVLEDMGARVDMGSPQTLADFIAWGKANFPAERTMLVVWNHGGGWRSSQDGVVGSRAVSGDDEFRTEIQTWQLGAALGNAHFDILAWDASLMQMLEVAHEVRAHADYIVGSEESPPGTGYPYDRVFGAFLDTPDAPTPTLARAFVDGMLADPGNAQEKITESVIDTSKLDDLATAVDAFARELLANRESLTTLVPSVRNASQAYGLNLDYVYRDLYDVADRIQAGTSISSLAQAAAGVKTAVGAAVVAEGHNSRSPGSHGVSIDFSSGANFAGLQSDYRRMSFGNATKWDEWLAAAP